MRSMFENPTVAKLAEFVEAPRGAGAAAPPEDAPEEPREAKGKVVDAEVVDADK